jgi:predicted AlkP superfamily phosphohydrolase/phosphomutase
MKNKNKVLVIGVDGATFDLIKPWVDQGKLPTFAKLMKKGASGNLNSTPNTNSASAWASFATGNSPGKHGIYYFDELVFGTYQKRYINSTFRKSKALWNYVSDAGKKVGVINVPMTFPAEEVNGFMIAGVDTPGIWSKGFTYPVSFFKDLQAAIGDYTIEADVPHLIRAGKKKSAVTSLLETIDKRYAATKHLMKHYPWDLFIVVFTATDAAQHFFWADMDPAFDSVIFQIYQRINDVISRILEDAGNSSIVVLSDHGGGFNQRGAEYLNIWLNKIGLLNYKETNKLEKNLVRAFEAIYHLVDRGFSRKAKQKLVKILPGLREKVEAATHFQNIDWSLTKAFSDGARDEIWINLKGREPEGTVEPGEEYEKLRDFIIQELSESHDIKTGKKVAQGVYRREEIYTGKYVFKAPDIYVNWQREFIISGLQSRDQSLSYKQYKHIKPPLWSGGHRENGILFLSGSKIKENYGLVNSRIIDITPTILYLLGLPIPNDIDGRVIQEAINDDYLRGHAPLYKSIETESVTATEKDYSEDEADKIKKKLKAMGYID